MGWDGISGARRGDLVEVGWVRFFPPLISALGKLGEAGGGEFSAEAGTGHLSPPPAQVLFLSWWCHLPVFWAVPWISDLWYSWEAGMG